jgi:hypothetical protein
VRTRILLVITADLCSCAWLSFAGVYILQPLVATIANICQDELGKQALAEQVHTILLRQSSAAQQSTVIFEGDVCVIVSNFEYGRGSALHADALKEQMEKGL